MIFFVCQSLPEPLVNAVENSGADGNIRLIIYLLLFALIIVGMVVVWMTKRHMNKLEEIENERKEELKKAREAEDKATEARIRYGEKIEEKFNEAILILTELKTMATDNRRRIEKIEDRINGSTNNQ